MKTPMAGGEAIYVHADVASNTDVEAMVGRTIEEFDRLDYAFNLHPRPPVETPEEYRHIDEQC